MPELSIVISHFNTPELLKINLASIQRYLTGVRYEIIVIDDGSKLGSLDTIQKLFPKVQFLFNKKNLGYSKSYNLGTKKTGGKYILHLNSDVHFPKEAKFDLLLQYLKKHPEYGIAGGKLVRTDGKLDLPSKRSFPTILNVFFQSIGLAYVFPKSKIFGSYYLTFRNENKIQKVECLMGAFMLIKREVFEKIGFLDERFRMYGEDIDFCLRAYKAGWKILYYPKITAVHVHGGTTKNAELAYLKIFHEAMRLYYSKHFEKKMGGILNALVYTGITLRYYFLILLTRIKQWSN
jgi:GT2 family glycosyltransferase